MSDQEEAAKEKDAKRNADADAFEECRTNALVDSFSICIGKNRFCPHALAFGHQFLCRHPHHAKFVVPAKKKK